MVDDERAARWGIQHRYHDAHGTLREAPDSAVEAVIEQLCRGGDRDRPAVGDEIAFLPHGRTDLPGHLLGRRLVTEDGADLGPASEVPPDLPSGYHRLVDDGDGHDTTLVVHPAACPQPPGRRWGWTLQLYADRSRASWGIGDLADARTIARWSADHGGGATLLLNPLHAPNLGDEPEPSPYFASSRCFLNPLALRVEHVADCSAGDHPALAGLAAAGRARNADRLIDRRAVWAFKREALTRLWHVATSDADRAAAHARVAEDPVLAAFASFTVALEHHGEPWTDWPADLRRPDGSGWAGFRRGHADRIAFHAWLQGLVAEQLGEVRAVVPVLGDLAVGTDRAGFDTWWWQDLFVLDGTRIGAPADQFNTHGQDWGLPPLDPWRLRAARYAPFRRMLRAAFEVGDGLRIDHVMGLFRLFWIPPGVGPVDGVYVRQPTDELLAIVALESERAGAWVVGEDLGTVEPGVREALGAHGLLSYRVLSLDDTPVDAYPEGSLASVSTHDLATVAGLWSGSDLADQQRLGLDPPVDDTWEARRRFGERIGVADDAPVAEVVVAAHRTLAAAPSRIVLGQLDDAALVAERPNMPGTTDQWPNWRLALPRSIEEVLASPVAGAAADALAARAVEPGPG